MSIDAHDRCSRAVVLNLWGFPTGGNGEVVKWGMTSRTVEPLLQNLTHHIKTLTYFTNHNHLQTVLMGNGELAH